MVILYQTLVSPTSLPIYTTNVSQGKSLEVLVIKSTEKSWILLPCSIRIDIRQLLDKIKYKPEQYHLFQGRSKTALSVRSIKLIQPHIYKSCGEGYL